LTIFILVLGTYGLGVRGWTLASIVVLGYFPMQFLMLTISMFLVAPPLEPVVDDRPDDPVRDDGGP
jgi:hypothetical protein